jgi:hypothetical protein
MSCSAPRRPALLGLLVLAAGLLTSCGYVGSPLPPSLQIPQAVHDLTATQRGNKIILHFSLPKTTDDGLLIKDFDAVEAEIGPDAKPFDIDKWYPAVKATPIDVAGEDQTSTITKELDATPWAGKDIAIAVRSSARKGRFSLFSNFARLSVIEPLDAPKIEVKATGKGYVIAWTPQRTGLKWRIMRRIPGAQNDPIEIGTTEAPPFVDGSSKFDVPYEYTVVAMEASGAQASESAPSEPVAVNEHDRFPPEVPGSITALAGAGTVEVTWERSPDADLKGYILYRSTGDGPFEKVGELMTTPAYSDHDVQSGKRYRYAVAAIDETGNISDKSSVAEIDFQ